MSPQREAERSQGLVKMEVPVQVVSSSSQGVVKSEGVEERGHDPFVKRDVVKSETVKSGVH